MEVVQFVKSRMGKFSEKKNPLPAERKLPPDWLDPSIPVFPQVTVKGENPNIRYFQHQSRGMLLKCVSGKESWERTWYRLTLPGKVWVTDPAMGAEYEHGDLFGFYEVSVYSEGSGEDDYETGTELKNGIMACTEFYAGAEEDCRIRLESNSVSGKHACFYFDGQHWKIRDLDSARGVKQNGKRIREAVLQDGDLLELGDGKIEFYDYGLKVTDGKGTRIFCFPGSVAGTAEWIKKSRYRGCLLGGAAGDALGYPVEFMKEERIVMEYGEQGIRMLSQAGNPANISDDTQMTLFAANGLVWAAASGRSWMEGLRQAYLEWLGTQEEEYGPQPPEKPRMWIYERKELHARRAPGLTCLRALRQAAKKKEAVPADNNSKGCGTVMRAAPCGLSVCRRPDSEGEEELKMAAERARFDAVLTHGHPAAAGASEVLAKIVCYLVQLHPERCGSLQEAVLSCLCGNPEVDEPVKKAVQLARDPSVEDLEGIHALGEGWIAEEALAIAVFCAVRYQDDFAAAVRAAVNHKGDSDSTGAVCGNILGAWMGAEAVEDAFDLEKLELQDVIEKIAEKLYLSQYGFDFLSEEDTMDAADRAYRRSHPVRKRG